MKEGVRWPACADERQSACTVAVHPKPVSESGGQGMR